MENVDVITQLVSNLAFPIAACVYLAKQNEKWVSIVSQVTETLKAMEIRLNEIENTLIRKGEESNDDR